MATASPRLLPSFPLQRSPTFKDPNPLTNFSPLDSFASDPLFSPFLSPSFSSRSLSSGSAASTASTAEHLQDAIRSLQKHLRSQVLSSHPSLLSHLRHAHSLLSTLRSSVSSLLHLRKDISDPRLLTRSHTAQLSNLHSAADLILSTSRLLKLSSRLRALLSSTSKSLDLAKAAEMHREIETLYDEAGLAGISIVEDEIRWLSEIGSHLRSEAIKAVQKGMDEKNQNDIWCGLQIYYSLSDRVLVETTAISLCFSV